MALAAFAVRTSAPVALFRCLPFAAYACAAPQTSWTLRAGVALLFALACAWLRLRPDIVASFAWIPVVYLYFAVAVGAVHWLGTAMPRPVAACGGALFPSALAFVVLPATLVHHASVGAMLVVGWEIMLAAHSYCVDARDERRPSFGDALFFMLVNPTYVFPERAERQHPARANPWAAVRIAAGFAILSARTLILSLVDGWARGAQRTSVSWTYAKFCSVHVVLVLGLYCAHSGLASIQIGWMRILGYRLPERYVFPFLARTPADFWSRWNRWVGDWARRYAYLPLARACARRWNDAAAHRVAVMCTFLAVGVLHDVGAICIAASRGDSRPMGLRFTAVFAALGLAILVWQSAARLLAHIVRPQGRGVRAACGVLSRVALLQVAILLAWLAIPVLRGGPLPRIPQMTHRAASS